MEHVVDMPDAKMAVWTGEKKEEKKKKKIHFFSLVQSCVTQSTSDF